MNPSNEKVAEIRRLVQETNQVNRARILTLEFVATMTHADVLTAQRMAKEALNAK